MESLKKPDVATNEASGLSNITSGNCNKNPVIRKDTKEYEILHALVSGKSLNRFQAARDHFDSCLNSTVSTLQSKGISIHRQFEKVPCVNSTKTVDVCRYSLLPSEIEKAEQLLGVTG
jgi:hypothetical protein